MLTAVLWIALLSADEVPERIAKFLASCERQKASNIKFQEEQIAKTTRANLNPVQKRAQLAKLRKELDEYKKSDKLAVPMLDVPLAVGFIGEVPGNGGNISDVVDERQMLVNCHWAVLGQSGGQQKPETVRQLVLIRGLSTEGKADGNGVDLPGAFEVTGTYKYATALGGTNTVFVLEPFDLSKAERHIKKPSKSSKSSR